MINTYKRLKRQRDAGEIDGFTLIELLIVIVVLGILAAVVIFALGGITGQSAVAACKADGATVSTAMAAWTAQNYPVAPTGGPLTTDTSNLTGTLLGGPFIQSWPSNGTHYFFKIITGVLNVTIGTAPYGNAVSTGTYVAYTGPSVCNLVA